MNNYHVVDRIRQLENFSVDPCDSDICACRFVNMTQVGTRNNSNPRETDHTSSALNFIFSSLLTGTEETPVVTELRKRGQIEPTSYIPAKATPPQASLSGSSGSQSRKNEFPANEFSDLEKKCR